MYYVITENMKKINVYIKNASYLERFIRVKKHDDLGDHKLQNL